MKKTLLLTLVVLCCASLAFAQGGVVWVSNAPSGGGCNLSDLVPGLCSVYVMHSFSPGTVGVQFMLTAPPVGLTYLSDTAVWPVTLGNSQTGVSVAYAPCQASGEVHALTVGYFCQTLTPACSTVEVLGHPTLDPPGLLSVNCSSVFEQANGAISYWNDDGTCPCEIVPTEETTWGQMKALYN